MREVRICEDVHLSFIPCDNEPRVLILLSYEKTVASR